MSEAAYLRAIAAALTQQEKIPNLSKRTAACLPMAALPAFSCGRQANARSLCRWHALCVTRHTCHTSFLQADFIAAALSPMMRIHFTGISTQTRTHDSSYLSHSNYAESLHRISSSKTCFEEIAKTSRRNHEERHLALQKYNQFAFKVTKPRLALKKLKPQRAHCALAIVWKSQRANGDTLVAELRVTHQKLPRLHRK
jgi:hypothetical protein